MGDESIYLGLLLSSLSGETGKEMSLAVLPTPQGSKRPSFRRGQALYQLYQFSMSCGGNSWACARCAHLSECTFLGSSYSGLHRLDQALPDLLTNVIQYIHGQREWDIIAKHSELTQVYDLGLWSLAKSLKSSNMFSSPENLGVLIVLIALRK